MPGGKLRAPRRRVLATPSARILATFIDGVLGWPFALTPTVLDLFGNSTVTLIGAIIAMIGLLALAVAEIYCLATRSATIGKLIMKIYIADAASGQPANWVQTILLRGFVWGLLAWIPFVAIVDVLFLFRQDRRTLHDMLAKTLVYER